MTKIRHAARLFAAASAVAAFTTPASAQQVDRIVAFGDSYADDGNFFEILGVNPNTTTVYSTGRFSGGTNYIDTLSQITGAPVVNFAVGGAMAQTFPGGVSNVNCTTYAISCNKGFTYEVNAFLAGGGTTGPGVATYPAVSGSFNSGDLVTVTIGGNDGRFYQLAGGTLAGAATSAAASAAAATTQLDRLVAAGAPTISFLAYDTALAPEVNFLPNPAGAAAVRTAFANAYNSGIQNTLAGYAADGVMVHYLDLTAVATNIQGDPAAYGIKTLVCPAFPNQTCAFSSSGYLFYGDQLHLTSDGFRILGRYVAAQLEAPLMIGGTSTIGLDNARQFGRSMTQRLDASAPRDGEMPEGMHLNIEGDGYHSRYNANDTSDAFRSSGVGVMGSLDFGFGSGQVGVAVRASRQNAHYYGDPGKANGHAIELGVYGGFGVAGGFVQGYAGLGRDNFDTTRTGVVREVEGSPKGHHSLAGLKAGYLMPVAGLRVGPVVGVDWAHAYVKSYSEDGDAALNLGVGSVKAKSLRGNLGLEARGDFDAGGTSLRPFVSAALEKQFADGDRTVYFSEEAAPTIVNRWTVAGDSKSMYGRLKGGLAAGITNSVRVDASIEGTVGKDGGNETSGNLAARIAF